MIASKMSKSARESDTGVRFSPPVVIAAWSASSSTSNGVLVVGAADRPGVRVVGAFLNFEAHGQVPDIGGVVEKAHPLAPGVEVEAGVEAGDVVDQVLVDDGEVAVVEEGGELVAARRDLRARRRTWGRRRAGRASSRSSGTRCR